MKLALRPRLPNHSSLTTLLALASAARLLAADPAAQLISPHFTPPSEFSGKLGNYRSPLLFNDGSRVKSAADWPRRRAEILAQWHGLMGVWPPVLEKPKLEFLSQSKRDNFIQHRVRVELAPGQSGEAWLLIPDGKGPFPAVLVPFYEPETSIGLGKSQFRDFALQLTKRGFVTLSIGSPGGDARKPEPGFEVWQPLSFLGYIGANCWHALANLPQVDAKHIGVAGHSYGGKWAMFASCFYEKFAAAAWSDPGIVFDEPRGNVNYWEPWYLGRDPLVMRKPGLIRADSPRTGAYKVMVETGRDLHEVHALMAPRPFLVSAGSEDPPSRWLPLNHAIAVYDLLGMKHRVAMTNRKEHSPNEESNGQLVAFFERFLKPTK